MPQDMPMPPQGAPQEQQSPEQLIGDAMSALGKLAESAPEFGEVVAHMEEIMSGGKPMPGNAPMEAGIAKVKPAM